MGAPDIAVYDDGMCRAGPGTRAGADLRLWHHSGHPLRTERHYLLYFAVRHEVSGSGEGKAARDDLYLIAEYSTQDYKQGFRGITRRTEWFAIDYTGRFWIS